MTYPLTALATILIVLLTFGLSFNVGKRRGEFPPPTMTGDDAFNRAFRIHYNTIEHMVLFIPLMWVAVPYWGDRITAALAAVWLIGRLLYAITYQKDPSTRTPGLLISLLALLGVLIGSVILVFKALF